MNILMIVLYEIVLGALRVWRLLTQIVGFIAYTPIKAFIQKQFNEVGVGILGTESHNMLVHNDRLYYRMICDGSLGLGEAYVEGWWDCKKLDVFFHKVLRSQLYRKVQFPWYRMMQYLKCDLFNLQTVGRAREVIDKHYDLGNYFFKSMLDKSMNYSCGYWKDAKNLEEAQQHKMELIGRKLKLKSGMRVLDLGCGWGELCKFLAVTYKVDVVGVTLSTEGAAEAKERCKGLSVEIRIQDYRDVSEVFDRIVSVELFEHVGPKNYRSFFELTHRCLSDDGIFLLHTSGHDNDGIPPSDIFVDTHIYPNLAVPNHKQIPKAIDNLFCIEDWHNFGSDYDLTLMAWHDNFVKNWHTIRHMYENPDAFYRMWTYFLLMGAAVFRSRRAQLWQIVLTKGLPGGYISVR